MALEHSILGAAYYAVEWLIRLGALAIVPLRRPPAATRTWLLVLFFLPVVGLLLFLAIGRPRFPHWRNERFRALIPCYETLAAGLTRHSPASPGASHSLQALVEKLGFLPAVGGNSIEMLDEYDVVVDRVVADIDAAKTRVFILVYIFADDAVGHRIAGALANAVRRGVACRVMLDPVGSHRWRRGIEERLRAGGVDVLEALPARFLRGRTRRDMRNHRKLFIVDGKIGYAGSQNIVAKDFRPGILNKELVVRAEGPVVAEMEAVVLADWTIESDASPPTFPAAPAPVGTAVAQLLPSGADYPAEGFQTVLVWQLHQARERVVIVTPYFIPDEDLLAAMRTAVARGVDVRLVLSAAVDQRLVNFAQRSYYADLLHAGVRIHLFRHFLLHAKSVSVDEGLAIVGSSNVDLRSFQLNEEASLFLYDADSVRRVQEIHRAYLEHSDELDHIQWKRRSPGGKLAENVARLVGPLL